MLHRFSYLDVGRFLPASLVAALCLCRTCFRRHCSSVGSWWSAVYARHECKEQAHYAQRYACYQQRLCFIISCVGASRTPVQYAGYIVVGNIVRIVPVVIDVNKQPCGVYRAWCTGECYVCGDVLPFAGDKRYTSFAHIETLDGHGCQDSDSCRVF